MSWRGTSPAAEQLIQPQIIRIPILGAGTFGGDIDMVTHLYRPAAASPVPIVIFSHGRSGEKDQRWDLKYPVPVGHGNFWLRKGFAVIAPVRPGYGETGGVDREASGASGFGASCRGIADYRKVAKSAGQAILASFAWLGTQSWARTDKILLVGNSVGGLATVGIGALNPPGVVGAVNFAGGAGGSPEVSPTRSCQPEKLTETYREFGTTTRIPSLWLYAENDLYWGPTAPREWHAAFATGGSKTTFVMTAAVPDTQDGHQLLLRGGRLWSPHVNKFVQELGI